MKYFNYTELIDDFVTNGKKINYKKHLSKISREQVIDNLLKKKCKLPINKDIIISNEPQEEINWSKLPDEIKNNLIKIYNSIHKSSKKKLKQLLEYKKIYPDVPAIYNYLTNVYYALDDKKKQYEIICETLEKFPNYFFGKISLANYYLQNNMINKIPEAFDNKLEIYQHFSKKKKVFHISEIRGFYSILGQYYIHMNKIEHALICYFLLSDIDEKNPATKIIGKKIVLSELEKIYKEKSKK